MMKPAILSKTLLLAGAFLFAIVDDPVDGRSMLVEGLWSKAARDE